MVEVLYGLVNGNGFSAFTVTVEVGGEACQLPGVTSTETLAGSSPEVPAGNVHAPHLNTQPSRPSSTSWRQITHTSKRLHIFFSVVTFRQGISFVYNV